MSLVNVLGKFGSTSVSKSIFTSTPAKYALTVSPNISSVNVGGIDYPAVDEGTTVTFSLVPNKVNKFNSGTVIPYTITGIETADLVDGNLTGQFIVGTDMVRTFTIDEDAHDDSTNEIMTMTLQNPAPTNAVGLSASVYIVDSSKGPPAYTLYLSGNGSTTGFVYENTGTTVTFALKTRGVYDGTQIPYTITGIDTNDLDVGSASLQGYFTVSSIITAGWLNDRDFPNPLPEDITYVTFNIKKDGIIEGNETMVITLSSHVDPVRGILTTTEGRTAQVIIKDEITWSSWTPDLSAVCLGQSFTQTRISNYNITESRPAIGTREPVWSSWTPALSTVAIGESLTQTRVDLNMLCNPQTQIAIRGEEAPSSDVVLFVKGEGPNEYNNNTFFDSSTNNFAITKNGTVTQGSFSPFPLNGAGYSSVVNGGSGYFNGSTDYLNNYTAGAATATSFGTNDFTIEAWVNFNSATSNQGICDASNQIGFGTLVGQFFFYKSTTSLIFGEHILGNIVTYNWTPIVGIWYHVAVSRSGTSLKMFINGTEVASATNSRNFIGSGVNVGVVATPYYFNGYISNLRVTKGLAVYTSPFTPPTSPVTLTSNGGATPSTAPTSGQVSLLCDFTNGGIIDSTANNDLITFGDAKISTSVKKSGTGSVYFPGNYTSYVTAPSNSLYNLHNNVDFTIECWVNWSFPLSYRWGTNDFTYILSNSQMALFTYAYAGRRNLKQPHYLYFSIGSSSVPTSFSPALNTWYHIAVTRQSGNLTVWVDGTSRATLTIPNQSSSEKYPLTIGQPYTAGDPAIVFNGYLDNFKITKGVAVYTATFTPPLT